MLFRMFAFLTLLVAAAVSVFGQVPAPHERETFVYFNQGLAPMTANVQFSGVESGQVSDEVIQKVRSALNLSDVQANALKALLTMRSQTTQQIL